MNGRGTKVGNEYAQAFERLCTTTPNSIPRAGLKVGGQRAGCPLSLMASSQVRAVEFLASLSYLCQAAAYTMNYLVLAIEFSNAMSRVAPVAALAASAS